MSEITAIWERIEAWYAEQGALHLLNAGASEEAIAEAEKQISVKFPPELRESLMRHDGTDEFAWPSLASLKQIIKSEGIWIDLLQDRAFDSKALHDASKGTGKTQIGWWVKGWIPIQDDSQGNGLVIDMVPGEKGLVSQLLYMDHESAVGASMSNYSGLIDYLSQSLQDIEAGEYVYLKNERIVVEMAEAIYYEKQQMFGK